MVNIRKIKKNSGISLVEIVLGSAIVLLVVIATVQSYNTYINFALGNQNNTQANFLLEEGVETMMYIRDQSWSTYIAPLTSGATYYLYFNGTTWLSTTTPQYVDSIFLRSVVVSNVNRDVNDDIASSGTNDANTKKVTVTVAYAQGHATTTKTLSTYITNIQGN